MYCCDKLELFFCGWLTPCCSRKEERVGKGNFCTSIRLVVAKSRCFGKLEVHTNKARRARIRRPTYHTQLANICPISQLTLKIKLINECILHAAVGRSVRVSLPEQQNAPRSSSG